MAADSGSTGSCSRIGDQVKAGADDCWCKCFYLASLDKGACVHFEQGMPVCPCYVLGRKRRLEQLMKGFPLAPARALQSPLVMVKPKPPMKANEWVKHLEKQLEQSVDGERADERLDEKQLEQTVDGERADKRLGVSQVKVRLNEGGGGRAVSGSVSYVSIVGSRWAKTDRGWRPE